MAAQESISMPFVHEPPRGFNDFRMADCMIGGIFKRGADSGGFLRDSDKLRITDDDPPSVGLRIPPGPGAIELFPKRSEHLRDYAVWTSTFASTLGGAYPRRLMNWTHFVASQVCTRTVQNSISFKAFRSG